MRLKHKTVRRLTLLAVASVLVLGAGLSLTVVRRWQIDRWAMTRRRGGMAALATGQHRLALRELGRYLQRGYGDDADAWLAFARARVALEEPDADYLLVAIDAYTQYLDLRPENAGQRLELLRLCNRAGLSVNARDEAARLRPADLSAAGLEHVDVLREEVLALAAGTSFDHRLDAVIDRLLQLAPLDIQGHLKRLDAAQRTNRGVEARSVSEALLRSNRDHPTAQLIAAASLLLDSSPEQRKVARVKIAEVLGLDPVTAEVVRDVKFPDAEFTSASVRILDGLQAFDLSLAALRRWRSQHTGLPADRMELDLLRALGRRLWQQPDHEAVIAMIDSSELGGADSELLAFRVLSLWNSGDPVRRQEADAIVAMLRSRRDDFRAVAWSAVLPISDPDRSPDPWTDAEVLRAAIKSSNRTEPIFLAMLGECYTILSRGDEARQAWKDASESRVCWSWPYPHVRRAETLLVEGRVDEAEDAASRALRIAHQRPMVNALWFEVQAQRLQRGAAGVPEPRLMLETLDGVLEQVEHARHTDEYRKLSERLLPARVLFEARAGQPQRAGQIARAALDDPQPLSERTLHRLISVIASERLSLNPDDLGAMEGVHGETGAWERVLLVPGLPAPTIAAAKHGLAKAILRQEPGPEQVDRARALVIEALSVTDGPALHETLGWIELKAGRRAHAVEAFRLAVGMNDPATSGIRSAVIGLATALASGSTQERQEAEALASRVDPNGQDRDLTAKLQRLRSLVQAARP